MKKFGKFIFGTLALASLAAGAYYLYKNFIKKDNSDDFDDFEDDFEDFDTEEEAGNDSREYVPINIAPESAMEAAEAFADLDDKDIETGDEQ